MGNLYKKYYIFFIVLIQGFLFSGLQAQNSGLALIEPSSDAELVYNLFAVKDLSAEYQSQIAELGKEKGWEVGNEPLVLGLTIQMPQGYHLNYQAEYVYFTPIKESFQALGFLRSKPDLEIAGTPAYEKEAFLGIIFLPQSLEEPSSLLSEVSYQLCTDEGLCFPPQKRQFRFGLSLDDTSTSPRILEEVTLSAKTDLERSSTPGALSLASLKPSLQNPNAVHAAPFPLLLVLLFAFLGGLLLNVMPCVLPVLSLKLFSLLKLVQDAKTAGHDGKKQARAQALAGSLGMISTFLGLAVVLIILRQSGQVAGWGFQFQNPWFVLALSLLVLVMALSLLDLFTFRLPFAVKKKTFAVPAPGAGSFELKDLGKSFFEGILLVVMATPCSAPFLGTAMGFALSAEPLITLLAFIFLALGFALPFFLLSWFPRLMAFLPKPGPWMDTVKQIFAFLLLGTALWLLSILADQTSKTSLVQVLSFLLLLSAVLGLWGLKQRKTGAVQKIFALSSLVLLVLGSFFFFPRSLDAPQPRAQEASVLINFSEKAVQESLDQGQPIFIDFWASWCVSCGFNEKTVLSDPEVRAAFAARNVQILRGDFTLVDDTIAAWIRRFGRSGVPFYQFIKADGTSVILPEILTKAQVLTALENL